MAITDPHIYYPSAIDPITGDLTSQTVSAFDLRWIRSWNDGPIVGTSETETVWVNYSMEGARVGPWPKDEFETAKAASLLAEAADGD